MATNTNGQVLSEDLLARCRERAPGYDRDNRFFSEDFEELREAGYLLLAVPKEFGGHGLSLAEVCLEQRRLAYHAAATAIAINMHLYWTGVAADLWRAGDTSLEWLLKAAADGEVFAAGHAEKGNDIPLLYSTTHAERIDGGYRFTGHKAFGSLTPVWTFLGLHGMDTSDPDHPKIVHAFMPRDTEGVTIKETWETMGMRATASQDTILDGAFVPDKYIARTMPTGLSGADLFVLAIFAWAEPTFANVYYGLAQRAFDLTVEKVKKKESIALTRSMAHHAGVQHNVAEMAIELEAIGAHIERIAEDWSNGVDHGGQWLAKLVTTKYRATEGSWRVVDLAMDTLGGFGVFAKAGFERLFRDARFGRIHPANALLTREIVAKTVLGLDFDEQPRWG
ncbi:MAG TPA: acyl-CoA dehydrogenase family protein [Kiloniellaceae bacterium]|nr:acyl-CoA dehydrogenase family protein [Kiloniellaceae bacterium]